MLLQIAEILSDAECAAIRDALSADDLWRDGKSTAKGAAQRAKNNLQADPAIPAVKGVLAKIEKSLRKNAVFGAAAQPASFARLMINRYAEGMSYGDHVDAPYIENTRSDLSFTVFLSAPEDYDGGELVIDTAGREDVIRGPLGSIALYPSTAVHRVEEVTRGARVACIGWVKSRVRSSDHRAILYDLESAIADLNALEAPQELRDRLVNVRNNLLRSFGD
ncbi:MAG: Fe2+-dependent dioxygenase [Pseudomonadota bacterium]